MVLMPSMLLSQSKFIFNENCKQAYNDIINLHFQAGAAHLEKEKQINPSNSIPLYLENYIAFFQLFIGENKQDYEDMQKILSLRIAKLVQSDKSSPYYKYCLADVYLQWAFIHVKFGDYVTAAYEINKAYGLLESNKKQYPGFLPNQKGLGLVHALVGSIPDNYKWLTSIIGMSGSVEQGISELEAVFELSVTSPEYGYLKVEALFMLTFLKMNLQSGPERYTQLQSMYVKVKSDKIFNSPLMLYCRAIVALKSNEAKQAELVLQLYKQEEGQYPFYYLDYLMGLSKFYRLDMKAANYFVYFLNNYKGKSFIQSSYQKLAWAYLLMGKKDRYKQYMQEVLKHGPAQIDEDKQAETEAKKGIEPNLFLLKARLLFDGGFFEQAHSVLTSSVAVLSLNSEKEKLEQLYRLGRIFHGWNKPNEAILYYNKTIDKGKESIHYYAANAALELGYIYEKQKKFRQAVYYFTLSTRMKNEEYRTSINQKAKAALERLKNKTGDQ